MSNRTSCLNVTLAELALATDLGSVQRAALRAVRNIKEFVTGLGGDDTWVGTDGPLVWARGPDRAGNFPYQTISFSAGSAIELIFDARGHAMMTGGWSPGADRMKTTDYQSHIPPPVEPDKLVEGQDS